MSSGSWVSERAVCTTWNSKFQLKTIYVNIRDFFVTTEQKWKSNYLINKLASVLIVFCKNLSPKWKIATSDQITCKIFEQRVLIAYLKLKNNDGRDSRCFTKEQTKNQSQNHNNWNPHLQALRHTVHVRKRDKRNEDHVFRSIFPQHENRSMGSRARTVQDYCSSRSRF